MIALNRILWAVVLATLLSLISACTTTNYVGGKKDGKRDGQGTLTLANGEKYVGTFKDHKRNGQGTYTYINGDKYVGEWKDEKINGQGTYTYANGEKYVGTCKDHNRSGQGNNTFANGENYVGEYKDNKSNGQGTYTFANGNKYVGEWKDSKRNGRGTEYASNGSISSQGIWADGRFVRSAPVQQASVANQAVAVVSTQPNAALSNLPPCASSGYRHNCFGTLTYANGDKFVGEFKDGQRNGQAVLTFSDGGRFVGEYKDDKANGQGNNNFANGDKFVGEYKDDKRHGQGTYTYANGDKYVGEFKDNKPHGLGTVYASNGSVVNQGIFADNTFVRSAPLQQEAASSAQPSSAETDRLTAQVEAERKKRQELEAQLAASVQPPLTQTNAPRRIAHALVIGNGAYSGSGRLENPVNDANAISQKLRSMGFTVTTVTDANRQRLVQSMAQFRRTAASADISLLYYAGHGVQIFGTNYILPTDVDQTDTAQATIQGVSLNSVVENFLPGKTKLVFLDACRDNALQRTNDRSVSKGLAPISAAEGTLISYATKDGQTAADGVGSKNSPFTQALLEHLNDPQDIAVVLRKVRERVMKITGGKQQPWEYGSLTGGELVLSAIKPK